jgi:16S rRNA (adenine1518-N6/adenine1519-N6)-dimethyltransferase
MRPKKKWGQNFLRNRGAVDRIVGAVEPGPDELVLEIGPGEGALTENLIALGRPVLVMEIDSQLADHLRARFADALEVRNEDAVDAALPSAPYRAVGNLPYNAGTPILRRVIADPHCRRAVFMVQKEVADRIVAKAGEDPYGFLSLYVQMYSRPRVLMTLDPRSFYPPPKVRSSVVVLDPIDPGVTSRREELLDLISVSFRMRRKKLVNNLIGWRGLTRDAAAASIERAGLDPGVRAEEIGLLDFDRLGQALEGNLQ